MAATSRRSAFFRSRSSVSISINFFLSSSDMRLLELVSITDRIALSYAIAAIAFSVVAIVSRPQVGEVAHPTRRSGYKPKRGRRPGRNVGNSERKHDRKLVCPSVFCGPSGSFPTSRARGWKSVRSVSKGSRL